MLKRGLIALTVAAGAVPMVVLGTEAGAGAATTITVTSAADSGAGTLRNAFANASTGGGAADDDVVINIADTVAPIELGSGLNYDRRQQR